MAAFDYDPRSILPSRERATYTSCFCEENVWKLCEYVKMNNERDLDLLQVVFISNQHRQVPLWMQKAGHSAVEPVIWDYHAILLCVSDSCCVYDLDSHLAFPCHFEKYSQVTFRSDRELLEKYHRKFRVVPARDFLENFASDRSHMVKNGEWLHTSPTYPCISTQDCSMNLDEFISMDPNRGYGEVMDLETFRVKFSPSAKPPKS